MADWKADISVSFQSTPSVGRATEHLRRREDSTHHFNPRPPWGGRPASVIGFPMTLSFQSTPSVGRATIVTPPSFDFRAFQSTPSVGRATLVAIMILAALPISIHALRGEGDKRSGISMRKPTTISIHALRGEGDRRRTGHRRHCGISIHALRGEGDFTPRTGISESFDFNPRPPWGGRRISITKVINC